jgi:BirA family biotin operon repressor/biotin-[acetyl-CoA-carboxylase] ligase
MDAAAGSRPGPAGTAEGGSRHLHWDAERLWQRLHLLLPDLSVEVVARTDSTNTRLLERARHGTSLEAVTRSRPMPLDEVSAGPPADAADDRRSRSAAAPARAHGRRAGDTQPCLLVAEHQTRGRGRLGRDWQASPGASLTFSLSLPLAPAAGWSGLSLAVGLALAEALEPKPETSRMRLKWPNDLWLTDAGGDDATGGGRKLGGILVETLALPESDGRTPGARAADAAGSRLVVVGVGLNVTPQPGLAVDGFSSGFACLQELDAAHTAPAVLHTVAEPLVRALLAFQDHGFAPLAAAYARRDLLAGRVVQTTLAEVPQGLALGVDSDGALRLQTTGTDGQPLQHRVLSGEVSVRTTRPGTAAAGEAPRC